MADGSALVGATMGAAVASGTGILFAATGEIVTELAGVLNLGIEGMMLVGALGGFAAAQATSSPWIGLLAGIAAGALLSMIFGVLVVLLRTNQVVTGLGLVILGSGVSGFYGLPMVGKPAPGFSAMPIPVLGDIPYLGAAFFRHDPLVYLSFLLVPATWFLLNRTRWGLHLRAAGEHPLAAEAAGLDVARIRLGAVAVGGALAGARGAYLSLAHTRMWVESVTGGQGWIALALVIFALWNPLRAALGAYLFGGITAVQLRLQASGTDLPVQLLQTLPYLVTILVLVVITVRGRHTGRIHPPAALGLPFFREDRTGT